MILTKSSLQFTTESFVHILGEHRPCGSSVCTRYEKSGSFVTGCNLRLIKCFSSYWILKLKINK